MEYYDRPRGERPFWLKFYTGSQGSWDVLMVVLMVWGYHLVMGKHFLVGVFPLEKEGAVLWLVILLTFAFAVVISGPLAWHYLKWYKRHKELILRGEHSDKYFLDVSPFYYGYSVVRVAYSLILLIISLGILYRLLTLS